MPLAGNQRRYLRSLGHHLRPVVQVGHQGVTPAVVKQLAQALLDHELVKVKLGESVEARADAANQLTSETGGEWVQSLGRTVLIYKRRDKKPEIELPKAHGEPTARGPKARRPAASDDADETGTDADADDALTDEDES